jgi:hypothetical protein
MSDRVERLFAEFLDAREAGREPDPADFIAQAGDEGEALAGMLTAYLVMHPTTEVSEEAVLALAASPELELPKPWPELLPELRERHGILRKQLLAEVMIALQAQGAAILQVEEYLHELETGQLDPRRVRPAVVDALAHALEAPRSLLESSRWLQPRARPAREIAFARKALASEYQPMAIADTPPPDPRIDDLFTGGPDG